MKTSAPVSNQKTLTFRSLFVATLAAAYAYVFFEWLFLVTKPSFMGALGFPQKLAILLFSGCLLYALCAALLLPLALLGRLPALHQIAPPLILLGALVPAATLAALSLLLVDNFTYTVFHFGVVSTRAAARGVYAVLFLAAMALWWSWLRRRLPGVERVAGRSGKALYPALALAALLPLPFMAYRLVTQNAPSVASGGASANRPHILWITSDGVFASSMSLYGYARDTTPRLKELAQSALVAENAFTNSGSTTGSIISMYTGRQTAATRVLYPPDVLRGDDAYRHLPGILRAQGYAAVQLTVNHYADANTLNVLNGFDQINGKAARGIGSLSTLARFLPVSAANFCGELIQRLAQRLAHIFFLAEMEDPYTEVTQPAKTVNDRRKLGPTLKLLETSDRPVFVHIHLLGTHGSRFMVSKQVFSAGQDMQAQERWNTDFYDDSIREFDQMIGRTIQELADDGLLDRTIVIIGSDHGKQWETVQRIPLIVRFPHGQHAGTITASVQNLDIAPTLLDYLGLPIPTWMQGVSLLKIGSQQRPIIAATNAGVMAKANSGGWSEIDQEAVAPPFYQFGAITVVYCQRWHRLRLPTHTLETGQVFGYVRPCSPGDLLSDAQAYQVIVDYLETNGFDASSLAGRPPAATEIPFP